MVKIETIIYGDKNMSKRRKISTEEKVKAAKMCAEGESGQKEAAQRWGRSDPHGETLPLSIGGIKRLSATQIRLPKVEKFLFYFTVHLTRGSLFNHGRGAFLF